MSIAVWQPLTTYSPGAVVLRATTPPAVATAPTNADFESGDTGWTKGTNWTIATATNTYTGTYTARLGKTGLISLSQPRVYERIYAAAASPVLPLQSITASCMVNQGAADARYAGAKVQLEWLDAVNATIRIDDGNLIDSGSGGNWQRSTVTGVAPSNAAYVRVGASGFQRMSKTLYVDAFVWNYAYSDPFTSLVFTAVQADDGVSAATEPVWPDAPGEQVIDGTVTWEIVYGSSVTWEGHPILVSGSTEPDWPLTVGSSILDNTINWVAVSRRVQDERCPNGPVVAIAASKIYCGDDDIIAYSATVNPLDWSTIDDAGYLPFGLNTHGSNPVSAMGLYRSNLVAFNSAGFQMWQVDQDPTNMALLDAAPVGCTEHRSVQPFQNDLMFVNPVGARNISIAGASTNLQAGSTGEPVDALVTAKIRAAEYNPISEFIPSYGQYWLIFGDEAFVLTMNTDKKGSWSRYVFPEAITDTTLLGNDLYLRTETHKVWKVSDLVTQDDVFEEVGVDFDGVIQWPHLDFGALGVEKAFVGVDVVATAPTGVSVSVGYDQRDLDARTDDYALEYADTLTGQLIPIPVAGPSFDLRLTFAANQAWRWTASVMYIQDFRTGT